MGLAVEGKTVAVVGLGRSGAAAARLLAGRGARVRVTDRRPERDLADAIASLRDCPIRYDLGGHPREVFQGADLIVMSPGIAVEGIAPLLAARERGVPVIGEVELACSFVDAPVAAITGSNGKSTTTALTGEIFRAAGRRVFVGGNLGRPLCEAAAEGGGWDWIVAELSSFQLETIRRFRPRAAALLNLSPNHLDRYRKMEDYRAAKMRIFENQGREDAAVLNADDPEASAQAGAVRARPVLFGRAPRPRPGVYLEGDAVVADGVTAPPGSRIRILDRGEIPLPGLHNVENVLAAAALGLVCGCPAEAIRAAVKGFRGLEHRLEAVRTHGGVRYVNDSKATTVEALARALESFDRPIVLIAGGRSKGGEFARLHGAIRRRVKAAVLIGEAGPELRDAWKGATELKMAGGMEEAVRMAGALAAPGDVVLLSPACASYDLFRDFEERGRRFKEQVNRL